MMDMNNNRGGGAGTTKPKHTHKEIAAIVLREHGGGAPMHYREIVEWAICDGLLTSYKKSPERSMNRTLNNHSRDIRNPESKGLFYRDEWRDGYYGLYEWRESGIPQAKEWNRRYVHNKVMKCLHALDGSEFAAVAMRLIDNMGFRDGKNVAPSARGTLELEAVLDMRLPTGRVQELRYRIQVRKSKGAISRSHVGHLASVIKGEDVSRGLIIGRGRVSGHLAGKTNSSRESVEILAGNELGHRLMLCNVGVVAASEMLFEFVGFDGTIGQAHDH